MNRRSHREDYFENEGLETPFEQHVLCARGGGGNIVIRILTLLYHARNYASRVSACNCAHFSAELLINSTLISYWSVHLMSGKKEKTGKGMPEID